MTEQTAGAASTEGVSNDDFISDDDLKTFGGWLRYQGMSAASAEELEVLRGVFEDVMKRPAAAQMVGLMKLRPIPGEHRYAVAVRDGTDLRLTLWVRRAAKGDVYVLYPRADRGWNPHTSYHRDGTLHLKSYNMKVLPPKKRRPLDANFHGAEHLGFFAGHGKGSGAVCDPSMFTGVVEVPPGVLGPRHGGVTVDLVEPGQAPVTFSWKEIVDRQTFKEATPWVVITVGKQ